MTPRINSTKATAKSVQSPGSVEIKGIREMCLKHWYHLSVGVTEEIFKQGKAASNSRLCGMLDDVAIHFLSIKKRNNKGTCEVCGVSTYWKCHECKKYCCVLGGQLKREFMGTECAMRLHNDSFFGLARCDQT